MKPKDYWKLEELQKDKSKVLDLYHRLWGKAVGTKGYDKDEWFLLFEILKSKL